MTPNFICVVYVVFNCSSNTKKVIQIVSFCKMCTLFNFVCILFRNPLAQMEEEKREHDVKMKKMESEMEQVSGVNLHISPMTK